MRKMRVILRYADISDAEEMLAAMDEGATQNLSFFSKSVTLERQREYLKRMIDSASDRLFLIRDFSNDGALLGTVGLHELDTHNKNARLGVLIFNPELRGSGIGSKAVRLVLDIAFQNMGLNKVYAKCFVTNFRMKIFLIELGFRTEAVLEKEYLLRGKYHDMVKFVIFREGFSTTEGG